MKYFFNSFPIPFLHLNKRSQKNLPHIKIKTAEKFFSRQNYLYFYWLPGESLKTKVYTVQSIKTKYRQKLRL